MKCFSFFLIFLFHSSVFSQTTEQDCITFGDSYYTSDVESKIPLECEGIFKSSTNIKSIVETESQDVKIHGYKNILFASIYDSVVIPAIYKDHIIAGEMALLNEIQAVEINESEKQVLVLQSSNQSILTYKLDIGGKIYPHKKLITDDLATASNVALDLVNNQVIAIHQSLSKLTFYKKEACVDGRIIEFSIDLQRTLNGNLTGLISPIDACVSVSQQKLYVYDETSNKIQIFNSSASGNTAPLSNKNIVLSEGQIIKKLDCYETSQKLVLTDQNGNTFLLDY